MNAFQRLDLSPNVSKQAAKSIPDERVSVRYLLLGEHTLDGDESGMITCG
jgi:hypothetical protein